MLTLFSRLLCAVLAFVSIGMMFLYLFSLAKLIDVSNVLH